MADGSSSDEDQVNPMMSQDDLPPEQIQKPMQDIKMTVTSNGMSSNSFGGNQNNKNPNHHISQTKVKGLYDITEDNDENVFPEADDQDKMNHQSIGTFNQL